MVSSPHPRTAPSYHERSAAPGVLAPPTRHGAASRLLRSMRQSLCRWGTWKLDWIDVGKTNKPSTKSPENPEIAGINHSQMGGVWYFYPHYENSTKTLPWVLWYSLAFILHSNSVPSQPCCHCQPLNLTSTTHHHPFNHKTNRKGGRRSGFVPKISPQKIHAMYQSPIVSHPISPLKPTENTMARVSPAQLPRLSLPRRSDGGEHTARRRICSSRSCSSPVIFLGKKGGTEIFNLSESRLH